MPAPAGRADPRHNETMKTSMTLTDILTAIGVVSIWGVNFVVIKIGLQDLPPVLFTALRFLPDRFLASLAEKVQFELTHRALEP